MRIKFFSTFKNQTYLQVRWVRDWTYFGWLEVSRTHLVSLGEFGKLPATLGASNPGRDSLTSLQVCLLWNRDSLNKREEVTRK
jgi:hypothetical protein